MVKSAIPRVAVGAIIFEQNKVLLVKRKNSPARGMWAIPGGKVRWGETLKQALKREIKEEVHVEIEPDRLFKVIELVPERDYADFHYIILDYLVTITKGIPVAGDDALAVDWFGKEDLKKISVTDSTRKLLQDEFGF